MAEDYGTLGMDTTGKPAKIGIDEDTYAVATIGAEHMEIHDGDGYSYAITSSAATNSCGGIILVTGTRESHFRVTGIASSRDQLFIYLYGGQSASGISGSAGFASSATSVNRNRTSSNTGNITWYTPSGNLLTTSANLLDTHYIGGGSNAGGTKAGGTAGADEEFVLLPSMVYGIKWINNSSATNVFNIRAFHYDVD